LRNGPTEACTLSGRTEQDQPMADIGYEENVPYEPLMRFLVEVPASTVDGLVRLGWLAPGQREDLVAILAAVKRLGRQPDVCRIDCEQVVSHRVV
jgi:hypothetical protein